MRLAGPIGDIAPELSNRANPKVALAGIRIDAPKVSAQSTMTGCSAKRGFATPIWWSGRCRSASPTCARCPRTQITRHDCVEGWSRIAERTGVPLSEVLDTARPTPEARFVHYRCFDSLEMIFGPPPYYETIDMVAARHAQTILAYAMNGDRLPVGNGAPLRVRVERQLGYKMAKYIRAIELVVSFEDIGVGRGSLWANHGYARYAGI